MEVATQLCAQRCVLKVQKLALCSLVCQLARAHLHACLTDNEFDALIDKYPQVYKVGACKRLQNLSWDTNAEPAA